MDVREPRRPARGRDGLDRGTGTRERRRGQEEERREEGWEGSKWQGERQGGRQGRGRQRLAAFEEGAAASPGPGSGQVAGPRAAASSM